jgi:arginine/ornithine N-succinyltransferase beta subunit
MARRNPSDQTAHNKGVRRTADELDREGWNVQADHISSYDSPPTVNGHVPDVYATKRGGTRIIEVETSREDDQNQHTAFRRSAGQTGANFYGYVVDSAGRRQEQFE